MAKIEILSPAEQIKFDNPPVFTLAEQTKYFYLPLKLKTWLGTVNNATNKAGFILLWGYCQAGARFYQPGQFRKDDLEVICRQQNIDPTQVKITAYNQRSFNYHKKIIRSYLALQQFDKEAKIYFLQIIEDKVARHYSPGQILLEVIDLLKIKRIEIPRYNRFALVITQAISDFEKNLLKLIEKEITKELREKFDAIFETSKTSYSAISRLKTISHSRKPKIIKESIQDFQLIQELYKISLPIIASLNLHIDTIKYYATWLRKASLFQINQLHFNKRYLYLISFLIHQYQLRQDIFGEILLTCVQATQNSVTRIQKEQAFQQKEQHQETLQLLFDARISYKSVLKQIETVAISPLPDDAQKIEKIKLLLKNYYQQKTELMAEPKLDELAQNSLQEMNEHDYYHVLEDLSLKLQNRVADILRHIAFDENENSTKILIAIQHYQKKSGEYWERSTRRFFD